VLWNLCPPSRRPSAHRLRLGSALTRAAVATQAWDCVVDEAVFVAMHLVEEMLRGTPAHVTQRLAELGADIAIIGRNQVFFW